MSDTSGESLEKGFNNYKIEIITDSAFNLGEGPFWDEETGTLLHIDTFVGDIVRVFVNTGRTEKYNLKDYISVIIPIANQKNRFIISRLNNLIVFDWNTKAFSFITSVGPEKFNDGKVDAMGRLWIGTLKNYFFENNEGTVRNGGALYKLEGCKLIKMATMTLPNGMAWSLCNQYFYIADTVERQIYVYEFNLELGAIRNKRNLLDFNNNPFFKPEELPDGMAIDKDGKLWVAIIFGGRVIQLDPKTGQIERWIPTPANQTTSIAFGGPNYEHMYVTTGNRDLTEEQKKIYPDIGKTLRITGYGIQGPGPANRVNFECSSS